jgi:hypothetical protein
MIGRLTAKITFANVVSMLALFVALSATSYAALKLPRNSVASRHIANGQVKRADIARNAVDSSRIAPESLLASDFKPGQLPAGQAGPRGVRGPKGDTGTVDTSRFYTKNESDAKFLATGAFASVSGGFSFAGARDCSDLNGGLDGPSVTVEVGPSGLVAIWAEAQILDFGANEGRVQLFDAVDLASCPTILRGNSSTNGGAEVKRTLPGSDAGTTAIGSSALIVRVTPGTHTFTLRYGATGDAGFTVFITDRAIWAQPL